MLHLHYNSSQSLYHDSTFNTPNALTFPMLPGLLHLRTPTAAYSKPWHPRPRSAGQLPSLPEACCLAVLYPPSRPSHYCSYQCHEPGQKSGQVGPMATQTFNLLFRKRDKMAYLLILLIVCPCQQHHPRPCKAGKVVNMAVGVIVPKEPLGEPDDFLHGYDRLAWAC